MEEKEDVVKKIEEISSSNEKKKLLEEEINIIVEELKRKERIKNIAAFAVVGMEIAVGVWQRKKKRKI